ncbi:hypothetical protein [Streptomyces sp. NBC_01618]|uniref:hypothetical protein n=1 Tax=Streptomyces sp. NBC_01618 TaxID=2975900 RepID=UPI00386BFCA2|nr:hypothetical protein OH735_26495 [Streptomyces sp. NBC_01618]
MGLTEAPKTPDESCRGAEACTEARTRTGAEARTGTGAEHGVEYRLQDGVAVIELGREAAAQTALGATHDHRAAVRSFLDRAEPVFEGR